MKMPTLANPPALTTLPRAVCNCLMFVSVWLVFLAAGSNAAAAVPVTLDPPVLSASGNTAINVSWTPKSSPITHYSVRYRVFGQTWIVSASNIPYPTTTHTITGLTPGTQYEVTVRPSNSEGNGAWSSASVLTLGSGTAPSAPTGLTATAASSSQINLGWTASSGATSYNVKRSATSGGPYTTVAPGVTGTSYSNTGLSASTTYHYVVSAVNSSGESSNSTQATASTPPASTPPSAPTGLTATAASSSQINLGWTASSGATSYNVKRSATSGGSYTTVAPGVTGTTYSNTGLTASTTYYYVVSAVNSGGESSNSSQANATTQGTLPNDPNAVPLTLAAPVLSASGSTGINVSWTPASTPITHYSVRYRVYGQTWIVASSTISGTATTYVITGLTPSTQYEVSVRPSNSVGNGAWSPTSVLTLGSGGQTPPTPTGLTATAASSSQINLAWSASSGATSYNVKRSATSGGPYTTVAPGVASTSYSNTGLAASTTYYYVVSAVNSGGESSNSTQASATTQAGGSGGDIIWQDLIDAAPVGQLTQASGDGIFAPTVAPTSGSTYANGSIVDDNGKLLRHNIPANSLGAFIVVPRLSVETDWATLEYDIRFDSNFDWQWGGKMGPGLIGVAPGHDIFEPTSCQARTGESFSTRLMWHGNNTNGTGSGRPFSSALPAIPAGSNDIVTYLYAVSPSGGAFGNCGWSASLGAMSKGVWHTIKQETKLNTVGQSNGVFRVWIDGVLRYENTSCNFRSTTAVRIQAVLWDIHRGGGLPQWGSPVNCNIDIRNVVVRDMTP